MKRIIVIVLLLSASNSFSQYYKTYDWETNPTIQELKPQELQEPSIAILKRKIVEFSQSETSKNIAVFETTHNIIRVNDETGIQRHNQVYIPMRGETKLRGIKARTIAKDGSITNLDENNIKQVENVDTYGNFQIFAIEGAQIDSDIEVLYTIERDYSPFGSEMFQTNYPIRRAEMVFITNNLSGNIKTYNTDQEFERTYLNNLLVQELVLSNISPVAEEEYSATDANKIYAAYQCFGNKEITQDILWTNTMGNVAKDLFPMVINETVSGEVEKNIIKTKESLSTYEKSAHIDNYIKSNFTVVENRNPQLEDIDYILKNTQAMEPLK